MAWKVEETLTHATPRRRNENQDLDTKSITFMEFADDFDLRFSSRRCVVA